MIGLEPLQGLIDLLSSRFPGPAIELGHQERLVAVTIPKRVAHANLALATIVVPGVVHETQAVIDGLADQTNGLIVGKLRLADVIAAHAQAGDLLAGPAQCALLHRWRSRKVSGETGRRNESGQSFRQVQFIVRHVRSTLAKREAARVYVALPLQIRSVFATRHDLPVVEQRNQSYPAYDTPQAQHSEKGVKIPSRQNRNDSGESVFGEKLLPSNDDDQVAEAIT